MMSDDAISLTLNDAGTEREFRIVKMSGLDAEQWLIRAVLIVGKNSDINSIQDLNSIVRALLSVPFDEAKGLLDALLGCAKLLNGDQMISMRDPRAATIVKSPMTFLRLRMEAAKLNFGFLSRGGASGFLSDLGMKPTAPESAA